MNLQLDATGIVLPCPSCGARNRLKYETLDAETRCGKCKTDLKLDVPVDLHSTFEFEWLTQKGAVPILIDFWAPWCGPCKMVAPELMKVASASAGEFVVGKLNTDDVSEIAARFQISSIPTMAVFHNGQELNRISGARPASAILQFIRQTAASAAR